MRQMIQIFLFDLRMSFKNFMGGYMVIVPMVILLILRLFLPAVDSTTINFAIVNEGEYAVSSEMIEQLSTVGDISTYDSIEKMERRLDAVGIAEGLYWDPDDKQYVSVVEKTSKDNETFSFAARYIRQGYMREHYPEMKRITEFSYGVPPELDERTAISPVATTGGAIFLIFMSLIAAFLLGIGIVEDKDGGTILALRVSPVSTTDYYIGRCIFPLIVSLLYGVITILVMGLLGVNIWQVLVVVLFTFSTTLVFGLFIGALGSNEVEAIGIGKISSMAMLVAILGGTLLPEPWHWVVWWSPVYWSLEAYEAIFTQTSTWFGVIWMSSLSLGLSAVYFLVLKKKIMQGLT